MNYTEKKYRVEGFEHIEKMLSNTGAKVVRRITSTHYYGEHEGNDVEKFVVYPDHTEIHVLTESDGKFTFVESKTITGKEAGLTWLKSRGYTRMNIVDMNYTEYAYQNGTVGLYVIDQHTYSVVLGYPEGQHEQVEKDFGLDHAEVILLPYNKYLANLGRLRSEALT